MERHSAARDSNSGKSDHLGDDDLSEEELLAIVAEIEKQERETEPKCFTQLSKSVMESCE